MCGYTMPAGAALNWRLASGAVSGGTSGDHTTGAFTGHFITLTNSGSSNLNKAVITSPIYQASPGQCLQFFYRIHGSFSPGSLSVFTATTSGSQGSALWTASGEQGAIWKKGQVTLTTSYNYQVS